MAGSGALGDLGAHIIDLGRYLVGEVKSVSAMTKTFIPERPLADGRHGQGGCGRRLRRGGRVRERRASARSKPTRFAAGRKNQQTLEINGEKGSIRFNLERMNELEVFWIDDEPKETQGFHNVLVSEPYHPWWRTGGRRGT